MATFGELGGGDREGERDRQREREGGERKSEQYIYLSDIV